MTTINTSYKTPSNFRKVIKKSNFEICVPRTTKRPSTLFSPNDPCESGYCSIR